MAALSGLETMAIRKLVEVIQDALRLQENARVDSMRSVVARARVACQLPSPLRNPHRW